MHELPPEELLSAYLDGEVTADEQAQAERLLAESPDARRLFEELQTLRSQFDQLPHSTLPADFGQRVLRQAERDILRRDDPDVRDADSDSHEFSGEPARDADNELPPTERLRKPLLFAMLAVATLVLISFFNPANPQRTAPRRNVALVEESARTEGWAEAASLPIESAEISGRPATAPEVPVAAVATTESTPARMAAPMRKGGVATDEPPSFADAPAGNVFEAKPGLAKDAGRGSVVSSGIVPPGVVANPTTSAITQADGSDGSGLMIVQCDVSTAVADSGAFGKLLARQQIQWTRLDEFPTADSQAENRSPLSGEERSAAAADAKPGASRDKSLEKQTRGTSLADGASVSGYDLIYIEATPQQLEATLTELSSLTDSYLSVEVAPAAGAPQQQRWQTQYARGRAGSYRQLSAQQQQLGDVANRQSPTTADHRAEVSKAGEPAARGPGSPLKTSSASDIAATAPAPQTKRGAADPAASTGGGFGGGGGGLGGIGGGGTAPPLAAPAPTPSASQLAAPRPVGTATQGTTPAASTAPTQARSLPQAAQPVANAPSEKLAEQANSSVAGNEMKFNQAAQAGRARSYSLPADANLFYEQGKAQVAQRKGDASPKAPASGEPPSRLSSKPAAEAASEEPPLLRALFVLQVAPPAEVSAPDAAPTPAKP